MRRFAVDARQQCRHVGRSLFLDAMTRVLEAGELVGIRALLVQAADEWRREWYEQFGFERSSTHPLHVILLIKDLRATIETTGADRRREPASDSQRARGDEPDAARRAVSRGAPHLVPKSDALSPSSENHDRP
jgi:hypothetical protein